MRWFQAEEREGMMVLKVLFASQEGRFEEYEAPLLSAFAKAGLSCDLSQAHQAEEVDYIVYSPNDTLKDFTPFRNAKLVMSLWAGVETILATPGLMQPLTRMVDEGLTQGMVEWVTGHVLRHHLGMDAHILQQDGIWRDEVSPPLAGARKVTILGLGALGSACARMLAHIGFDLRGWSARAKDIAGVQCFHGAAGLEPALEGAEILVLLLPDTPQTTNLIDAKRLAKLAQGAVVINPGRGPLVEDGALLAALDAGQLSHATLDVFRIEPLPPAHPFWAHEKVTVVPHRASVTRAHTAAKVIAENIRRSEAGEPPLYLVDRERGY